MIQTRVLSGEDISSGQFFILDSKIVRFDPETGEFHLMAYDFEGWAQMILNQYESETGYPLAHEWQILNGRLDFGKRLLPKKPFLIGGSFEIDNLFAMDAVSGMRLRGEIAQQIATLPDGTVVDISFC